MTDTQHSPANPVPKVKPTAGDDARAIIMFLIRMVTSVALMFQARHLGAPPWLPTILLASVVLWRAVRDV